MAEAIALVGLASAIVTFLGAGAKFIAWVRDEDIMSPIADISAQLPLLIELVEELHRMKGLQNLQERNSESLARAIAGCTRQVQRLAEISERVTPSTSDTKITRVRKAAKRLAVHKDLGQIQRALQTYKSLISLKDYEGHLRSFHNTRPRC